MGCCSAPEATNRSDRAPQRFKECNKDFIWLILFIGSLGFGGYVYYEAWNQMEPIYTSGTDSFGNICGKNNADAIYYTATLGDDHAPGSPVNETYPSGDFYNMNRKGKTSIFDSRFSDVQSIANNKILSSPGLTYCASACPGANLPESVKNEEEMQKLAVQIYIASKIDGLTKSFFANSLTSHTIDATDANAIADELWCDDFMSRNNYTSNQNTQDFCVSNKVLLPNDQMMLACVPNQELLSVVVRAYTNDDNKVDVAQNGTDSASSGQNFLAEKWSGVQRSVSTMKNDIILACVVSLFIAIIVILIIQVFTKYIVKLLVIAFFLTSIFGTVYVWVGWWIKSHRMISPVSEVEFQGMEICGPVGQNMTGNLNSTGRAFAVDSYRRSLDPNERIVFDSLCQEQAPDAEAFQTYQYITWAVTVIAAIMLVTICCCWGNISLAVELFDEAGQAVFSMLGMLAQPAFTIIFVILTYVVCAVQILHTMQVRQRIMNEDGITVRFEGKSLCWEYAWVYMLFNGFWMAVFIDGLHQATLAGAVANWYFCEEKIKTLSICPGFNAMKNLLKYNLGSIAFGSLLVAIVRTIQVIIWIVERQAGMDPLSGVAEPPKWKKAVFACLKCCTACVEKFLAFINRNAFIGIAIFGYDFCRAAQKCLALKVENAGRAATTSMICVGVLFLGKVIAVAGSLAAFNAIAGYNNAKQIDNMEPLNLIVLYVIVGVFSFIITSVFLSVYEMALDTIFICFCEDQQRNNGKDRPYFSSAKLQSFMRKNA